MACCRGKGCSQGNASSRVSFLFPRLPIDLLDIRLQETILLLLIHFVLDVTSNLKPPCVGVSLVLLFNECHKREKKFVIHENIDAYWLFAKNRIFRSIK